MCVRVCVCVCVCVCVRVRARVIVRMNWKELRESMDGKGERLRVKQSGLGPVASAHQKLRYGDMTGVIMNARTKYGYLTTTTACHTHIIPCIKAMVLL